MQTFGVFDLILSGRFVRNQACTFLREPSSKHIQLMVSHRWETLKYPDPENLQFHGVIRFIIQSCMMAMGSSPNVFNAVDFSEIILSPSLYKKLNGLYSKYEKLIITRKSNGQKIITEAEMRNMQTLLKYLTEVIGENNLILVANDIPPLAFMMSFFDIWYDYTSMPQAPFTEFEKYRFDEELNNLDKYFSENHVLINWAETSIKRAWCFFEAALSSKSKKQSIFSSENSKISSKLDAPIEELMFTISKIQSEDFNIDFKKTHKELFANKDLMESQLLNSFIVNLPTR